MGFLYKEHYPFGIEHDNVPKTLDQTSCIPDGNNLSWLVDLETNQIH